MPQGSSGERVEEQKNPKLSDNKIVLTSLVKACRIKVSNNVKDSREQSGKN